MKKLYKKVAIKILEKQKIIEYGDLERVTREIQILKKVKHPNIIQLYQIIESSKHIFLVMEYAENGELYKYILQRKKLSENESCILFSQCISAVEYIHKFGICHRLYY